MKNKTRLLALGPLFALLLPSCVLKIPLSSSPSFSASSTSLASSSSQPLSSENSTPFSRSSASSDSSLSLVSSLPNHLEEDHVPTGYHETWGDEFDGVALNSQWVPQLGNGQDYGIPGWGNGEQEYYQRENATVWEGLLHLTAKKESVGGLSYTSARLRTMSHVTLTYGYVAAKIKLPLVVGLWPAFWMLPETGSWPVAGEIDIMEARGRIPDVIGGTVHSANATGKDVYHSESITLASPIDEWHVYAVEWTADAIAFSADGLVYNTVTRETWVNGRSAYGGGPAPFDQPFHLLLNLAVGGQFDGYRNPPDDFLSAEMLVDHVRIYQS